MAVPVLNYDEARKYIKDGDIVFIKDRPTLLANIIRFFTKSDYSHVGIAFWMKSGGVHRLMMVEAQGGTNRRIVNMSKYRGINLDVIQSPRAWSETVNVALARLSEVPYGYFEALYVGIVESAQKYLDITLPRKNFPGEICSEFVAKVYNLPEKHISPQELFDELIRSEYKFAVQVKG